jgi:hypothetical protein
MDLSIIEWFATKSLVLRFHGGGAVLGLSD